MTRRRVPIVLHSLSLRRGNKKIGGRRMRGRDREIAVVLDMIRAAKTGRGGVLLVEGELAVGKSPLLPEFSAASAGYRSSGSTAGARARPELIAPDDPECSRMVLAPLDEDATAQL